MHITKLELSQLLGRNDLLRAALLVGRIADNRFPTDPYVETVMGLAAQVWNQCRHARDDVFFQVSAINRLLFQNLGLENKVSGGKQIIDDPHRFYLHNLLDQKRGSPIAVTVLYAILAEQIGLVYECFTLPSVYLLKIVDVVGDIYIEPYDSGKLLSEDEFQRKFRSSIQKNRMLSTNLYEKITGAQLLGRLVQQLKHAYILKGKALEAVRAVEILSVIYPQSPEITRDRGILYCEIEYFSKAMEDLTSYLRQRPNAEDVGEIKKLTHMLKGYREVIN